MVKGQVEGLRFEIYFRFSRIQAYVIFTSYGDCLLITKLYVPSVGFSVAGLDHTKFGFYQFQSFLFIVVIAISILLKTTYFQKISIHSQLLVKNS